MPLSCNSGDDEWVQDFIHCHCQTPTPTSHKPGELPKSGFRVKRKPAEKYVQSHWNRVNPGGRDSGSLSEGTETCASEFSWEENLHCKSQVSDKKSPGDVKIKF